MRIPLSERVVIYDGLDVLAGANAGSLLKPTQYGHRRRLIAFVTSLVMLYLNSKGLRSQVEANHCMLQPHNMHPAGVSIGEEWLDLDIGQSTTVTHSWGALGYNGTVLLNSKVFVIQNN